MKYLVSFIIIFLNVNSLLAQITAGDPQNLCANFTNLEASASTGRWEILGGACFFADKSSNNTLVTDLGLGKNTFRWHYTEDGIQKFSDVEIYNNLPTIAKITLAEKEICENSWTLVANSLSKGTGRWSTVEGGGSFDNATNFFTNATIPSGRNIYRWTSYHKNCSTSDDIVVTNNSVEAEAQELIKTCGSSTNLAATLPTGATGFWSIVSSSAKIEESTSATSVVTNLNLGASTFRWNVKKGSCEDDTDQYIINQKQNVTASSSVATSCSNKVTMTGSQVPENYSHQWSIVEGEGEIIEPNNYFTEITNLKYGLNKIVWTVQIDDCVSSIATIVANRTVSSDAGDNFPVCKKTSSLSANTPKNGAIGKWTTYTGDGIATSIHSPTSAVTNLSIDSNIFRWTVTSADGSCSAFSDVEVFNSEFDVSAGNLQTVCNSTAILEADMPLYSEGKWEVIKGKAKFNNNTLPGTQVSELDIGENILKWTVSTLHCFSSNTVTLMNQDYPAIVPEDFPTCTSTTTLEGNSPSPGTGTWKVVFGEASVTSPSSQQTEIKNLSFGKNTFEWRIDIDNCNHTDQVTITNNYIEANAGDKRSLCANTAILDGNIIENATGKWTASAGVVLNSPNNFQTIATFPTGESTATWSVDFENCSSSHSVIITNNTFEMSAGTDVYTDEPNTYLRATPLASGQTGEWKQISGLSKIANKLSPNTQLSDINIGNNEYVWTVDNGICKIQDVVKVVYTAFSAKAGDDQNICSTQTTLQGNSSGTGVGRWRVLKGEGHVLNPSDPKSKLTNVIRGEIELEWSITQNGYSAFDTVVVRNQTFDVSAGEDQVACNKTIELEADNLGEGFTGTWSTTDGYGRFDNLNKPTAQVTSLIPGRNEFQWLVRNRYSCQATSKVVIMFKEPPVAAFNTNTDSGCSPLMVLFSNVSERAADSQWTFGDGTSSDETSPNHNYAVSSKTEEFNIQLVVRATNLCTDTATHTIRVSPSFDLDFSLNELSVRIPYADIVATVTEGKGMDYYRWEMGDGQSYQNKEEVSHTFEDSGIYEVRVFARNSDNCEVSKHHKLEVLPPLPVPAFEAQPASGCPPLQVQFVNRTKFADAYNWELGDGTKSTSLNPKKYYTEVGVYPVVLTATNNLGSTTYSQTIYVEDEPTANFSSDIQNIVAPNQTIQFENHSTGAVKYEWIFGDGTTSLEKDPTHVYTKNGLFTVVLKASTEHNCVVEKRITNYIAVDISLAIDETPTRLKIFPNPSTDFVQIERSVNGMENVQVQLYSTSGMLLSSEVLQKGKKHLQLDVKHLLSGTYIIVLKNKGAAQSVRFVKN